MTRFRVLVPAAGMSQRFVDAGHATPKPDLVINHMGHSVTMLDWALSALPHTLIGPIVAGVRTEMTGPFRPHVRVNIENSMGQAHTLLAMMHATCLRDEPVLVINSDVVFAQQDLVSTCEEVLKGADSGILVYRSESKAMSYVDRVPYATRFVEKNRISAFAMAGAWAFRSSNQLQDCLEYAYANNDEPYLSHAMNAMRGVHACHQTEAKHVLDWGTPEALAATGARIVK